MMKAQMTPLWDALDDRRTRFVNAFGRLKPGVSRAQAEASLQPYFKSVLEMEVEQAEFSRATAEDREAHAGLFHQRLGGVLQPYRADRRGHKPLKTE